MDYFKVFVEDDGGEQGIFFDFEFVSEDGRCCGVVVRRLLRGVFRGSFLGEDVG